MPLKIENCRIISLPKILDQRGNLTFFEGNNHIPFDIARVYWIYDVPGGATRGGHAYKQLEEVFISLSGSFDVVLEDGYKKRTFSLNRSYLGLYAPAMIWRNLENFSTNAVCMIAASRPYSPDDYIVDYEEFLRTKRT